jgi:nitroimidazol reductase NimA-like FMN-containing flavoprotein (pyridoxamine 5'-phosphate oxidase superfamily)
MITNLNEKECLNLMADNYIGQLAYIYKDRPLIVPISYYFDKKNIIIIGYSDQGHKTMAMRKQNKVSLQVSNIKNVDNWCSVLAHGVYEEISGPDAKKYLHEFTLGIKDLILRKEERNLHFISEFSSKTYTNNLPIVFKINIEEMTGRKRVHETVNSTLSE